MFTAQENRLEEIYEDDLSVSTLDGKFLLIPLQYFHLFLIFKMCHEDVVAICTTVSSCFLIDSFMFDSSLRIGLYLKDQDKK